MMPAQAANNNLIIHYFRYDGLHPRAQLWIWDGHGRKQPQNQAIEIADTDDYGVCFELDPAFFADGEPELLRIGFTLRLNQSWHFKDGGDRYWRPELGREIWLVGNEPQIYRSAPNVRPRILCAWLDSPERIELLIKPALATAGLAAPRFELAVPADGSSVPLHAAVPGTVDDNTQRVELELSPVQDWLRQELEARLEGYLPSPVLPRNILFDAKTFGAAAPLGAFCEPQATIFRAFAPVARQVEAVIYDDWRGDAARRAVALRETGAGIWEARVEGNLAGKYYALRPHNLHDPRPREFIDPYAVNTAGAPDRSRITDLRAADPPGFRPIQRPAFSGAPSDAVIYEMHVRDFTISADSGVAEKGRYRGFVEPGTRLPGDAAICTGLDHLRELGVTHVQLMPVADFDNDEQRPDYDWGYMPGFFFSPEGMYAGGVRGEQRVREFKELIQGLHAAGIRVILDVVYNHTALSNTFEQLAPGYYHRRREDGSFWNGSGCGNELRSEAPLARRCILEACRFWVEEYGVDGFRFDLLGLIDLETVLRVRAQLDRCAPGMLFYGEPWTGGPCGLARSTDKYLLRGTGIGAFNDQFRNALKGVPDGGEPGYVQNGSRRDGVIQGIKGAIDDWTADPGQSINYADCHDNLTLWDKLAASGGAPEAEREKMQRLACGILAVSQGVMFIHGGAELLRTKGGEHNSYNKGDAVNAIRWRWKRERRATCEFFQGIIALRRSHPVFRLRTADAVRRRLKFHDENLPNGAAIAFSLDGAGLAGESWLKAAVLINPLESELVFNLPFAEPGALYVHGPRAAAAALQTVRSSLAVPGRSLAVVAVQAN